jgi:membrane peptidoglycan carboxypeptidase
MSSYRPAHPGGPHQGRLHHVASFLGVSALAGVLVAGVLLPIAGTVGLTAKATARDFDSPVDFDTGQLASITTIQDASGNTIASVYNKDRVVVPLSKMSKIMQEAIVAIEDSRFYEHGSLDIKGTLRALGKDAGTGESAQGGSTLAQQYVKNVLVEQAGNDKEKVKQATGDTLGRKLQELKYAIAVEKKFSKDQILENYLNIVYFGNGYYGVEAAARGYFGTTAAKLTLAQSALLAGLVQNPNGYNPITHPSEATKRRNVVLKRMADLGKITQNVSHATQKLPLGAKLRPAPEGCANASPANAAFFCQYVEAQILRNPAYGKTVADRTKFLYSGLTIKTTLDPQMQDAASTAIGNHVYKSDDAAAAIVLAEPGTGKVKAMAQSKPFGTSKYSTQINLSLGATDGAGGGQGFQAGSTFKTFVLAAAMQQGISPSTVLPAPAAMNFSDQTFKKCSGTTTSGDSWTDSKPLKNDESSLTGPMNMRQAIAESVNTYFVPLEQQTGLCDPVTIAGKLGVTQGDGKPLEQVASFTLGSLPVSPLDMAEAYAALGADGKYCPPNTITAITGHDGKAVTVPATQCTQAVSADVAREVTSLLTSVMQGQGTGANLALSRPSAGKTGTTDKAQNVWFVGYTPDLSGAAWVGHIDGTKDLIGETIGGNYINSQGACGACLPGPIWRQAMNGALSDTSPTDFPSPPPGWDGGFNQPNKPDNPQPPTAGATGGFPGGALGGLIGGTGGKPGTLRGATGGVIGGGAIGGDLGGTTGGADGGGTGGALGGATGATTGGRNANGNPPTG